MVHRARRGTIMVQTWTFDFVAPKAALGNYSAVEVGIVSALAITVRTAYNASGVLRARQFHWPQT